MTPEYKKKIWDLMEKHNIKNCLYRGNLCNYLAAAHDIFPFDVSRQIKFHVAFIIFQTDWDGLCQPLGQWAAAGPLKYIIILPGAPEDAYEEDLATLDHVTEVLFTIAHEVAHAWRIGGLGDKNFLIKKDHLEEECAVNALAKKWGFDSYAAFTRTKKPK